MNSFEKEKLWWETQKNGGWKILTSSLSQDPVIHARFDNFIKTFYWRFRGKNNINKNAYPEVDFQGFKEFEESEKRAGYCKFDGSQQIQGYVVKTSIKLTIFLNQQYLLDKLGMDKLITNKPTAGNILFVDISFDNLIGTIAHELAHAYQQTVNNFKWEQERSQCESTGKRGKNGNLLYPQLVAEHTRLTAEIKQLITSSEEYQTFQTWWRDNKQKNNEKKQRGNNNSDKCQVCDVKIPPSLTYCSKCISQEQTEFSHLSSLLSIQKCPNLTILERNYQIVKNNPLYISNKKTLGDKNNKIQLDRDYNIAKNLLQSKDSNNTISNTNNDLDSKTIWIIGGGIMLIMLAVILVIIGSIIAGPKKKKKH